MHAKRHRIPLFYDGKKVGMKKKLPIGISSFRKIREDNKYYADKTLIIRYYIDNKNKRIHEGEQWRQFNIKLLTAINTGI